MSQEHPHAHPHHHGSSAGWRRLTGVLVLTFAYMLAEVIGGIATNSLALLSDAGHMLTDVAAIVLALAAIWFSAKPVTTEKTYGYYRLEILAALANGVALVVISLFIFYEAIGRIRNPQSVLGLEVTLIALGGLVINAVSVWLLRSVSEENLNVRGAFLHVVSDALGSVAAIASGIAIWQWGWSIADPIMSICVCLLIVYGSWQLIRDSVNVLLEGTPPHINVRALITTMHEVKGVIDVHDLHVWTISSGKEALSAHVNVELNAPYKETLESLQERLRSRFNIGHVTLQIESPEDSEEERVRLYQITGRNQSEADAKSTRSRRQSTAARKSQN